MINIASKEQFENEIKKGKIIVDFYATWCGPCRMLSPLLEDLEEKEDVTILKVNVDEQSELASEFIVSSIPYLVFFKEGKKVNDHLGYVPYPELLRMKKEYLD